MEIFGRDDEFSQSYTLTQRTCSAHPQAVSPTISAALKQLLGCTHPKYLTLMHGLL